MIPETQDRLRKAQKHYKNNFDKNVRNNAEHIKPGDNVVVRIERKDEREIHLKIEPIA